MIFVTVGTTDFDALVRSMDLLAPQLGEEVEMQIGHGEYEPRHCSWFRFASSLEPYYARADVVVAHGGLGTVMEVLRRGGKLIGVANPDRYDQHQEAILRRFETDGYLVACYDLADLANAITHARTTPLRRYPRPQTTLHLEIGAFLANRRR